MKILRILNIVMVLLSILFGTLFAAEPIRKWRSKEGKEINAVWDRENDEIEEKIVLIKDGKKYRFPIEKLSEEDIQYVQQRRREIASSNGGEGSDSELKDDSPKKESVNEAEINNNQTGDKKTLTIDGIDYTFCWCPPGSFIMGSPESEADRENNETQHQVTISRGFWMQETEVTQQMWKSVMGNNPSEFNREKTFPVMNVSWNDCQDFIEKFNKASEMPAEFKVSLPTEAQWEYACRAGTTTPFNFGSTLNGDNANCVGTRPYGTETPGKNLQYVTVVKTYKPNAWGLYDMHGNVWEWCSDWYDDDYYAHSPEIDPAGAVNGSRRVFRGGSWGDFSMHCRSAIRNRNIPALRFYRLGFRLILVPSK